MQARMDASSSNTCSLAEVQALPDGMDGVYCGALQRVAAALIKDGRVDLLELLRRDLLPALAVMQEPLTAAELRDMMGGSPQPTDVSLSEF